MASLLLQCGARIQSLHLAAGPSKIAGDVTFVVVDTVETEALRPEAELGFDVSAEHLNIEPWRMKTDPASAISIIAGSGRVSSAFDDMSMNSIKHPIASSTEAMFELQRRTNVTLQAAARHGVPTIEIAIQNSFESAACAMAQPSEFWAWLTCGRKNGEPSIDTTCFINVSGHGGG